MHWHIPMAPMFEALQKGEKVSEVDLAKVEKVIADGTMPLAKYYLGDFRDKLIEQFKGTFGKYYDYHRRDIATNEVDYLNVEDPDVFSHRAWELKYQREQEIRRNQPARTKKKSYDIEL